MQLSTYMDDYIVMTLRMLASSPGSPRVDEKSNVIISFGSDFAVGLPSLDFSLVPRPLSEKLRRVFPKGVWARD